jgi:methylenetetrahydrofolate reductase (NADPH)
MKSAPGLWRNSMANPNVSIGAAVSGGALSALLKNFSAEVTARERRSLDMAGNLLAAGTEVFVAALPKDRSEQIVDATRQLARVGLTPTPHIVARNLSDVSELDDLLVRLAAEAGVTQALVLGGDRDSAKGALVSSRQLIETGLFQKHGLRKIFVGVYPEGHPRISDQILNSERAKKLEAAAAAGLQVELISQCCFEASPIIALAERLYQEGVSAPLRVGVAGPAQYGSLLKYALTCGVGPSLRALKERRDLAKNAVLGETPERLVAELANALNRSAHVRISGLHFFTFGSLENTATWTSRFA